MTVGEALNAAIVRLSQQSASARLDAEVLLGHVLARNRAWLRAYDDAALTTQQMEQFESLLERRLQGEPVAYLIGEQEFWSMPLKVSPHTLIPRADTECLVDAVLAKMPLADSCDALDLGTGTGAIALALKRERPEWRVTAVDRVSEAVILAKENATLCGLVIEVLESDWYSQLDHRRFDLIVSNPPYIDDQDPHLADDGVCCEPLSALVAGEQGLADLRIIIQGAKAHLNANGWVAVEHGFRQADAVAALFCQTGFSQVQTCPDLAGQPRVTLGCWKTPGE